MVKKETPRWHIRSSNGSKVKLDVAFDRDASTKTTHQEAELNIMKQIQKKQQNIGGYPVESTIVMTKEKKETFTRMMNEISTKCSDTWTNSIARIETNKKAARERGRDPLNTILLSHPDIISSNSSALKDHENGTNNL